MTALSFSLTPESTGRQLSLTALNLSRTAYASFAFEAKAFLNDYRFSPSSSSTSTGGDRFTCQLLNKALQSVFKGRTNNARGYESTVERCEVVIQDQPDITECRLIVKMLGKHGMTKTYRLTYESVEVMHALFDKSAASQGWKISSRLMREYIEFFGPKTEQLDLLAQEGKAIFTSFTEKIQHGKEVLKQPLETAISIHTEDFQDFHMQEKMHIVISVKDFKAIVTHADTLRGSISAYFSYPNRPLQFNYQNFGMYCEFTLMTTGDYRAPSPTLNPKFVSTRSSSVKQPSTVPQFQPSRSASEMPPPAREGLSQHSSSQSHHPALKPRNDSLRESGPELDTDSLFMPGGDDDQTWDPPNYEDGDGEEMLGWDASAENPNASFQPALSGTGTRIESHRQSDPDAASQEGLPPTQRLSQLNGMFD
ncbi:rad9 protein [Teratosphaeria destructans]|uniref:DNA repair protein rad9 n=1 Tax=Teratosphaeria destructans TaxID=418781 RepID=A0A9W7W6T2_9PEZI|nr:rad9 protein [Teratosphaeria destructans]